MAFFLFFFSTLSLFRSFYLINYSIYDVIIATIIARKNYYRYHEVALQIADIPQLPTAEERDVNSSLRPHPKEYNLSALEFDATMT